MNVLSAMAITYGTDKRPPDKKCPDCHGYTDYYYELLKDHRYEYTAVLELGVWEGASHLMWKDFFPKATIYGVDDFSGLAKKYMDLLHNYELVGANLAHKLEWMKEHGLNIFVCDQTDKDSVLGCLEGIKLDLIIDDGGHGSWQQQRSFAFLWDQLKPGGYYIIEDLAVCEQYREYADMRSTTRSWIESLMTEDRFSYYMDKDFLLKLEDEIAYIHLTRDLGVFKKRG